jgi:pimeloyl-ACP methyl ester carboxylesterase
LWTDRLAHLVQVFGGDPRRWVRAEGFAEPAWADALARQSAGRSPGVAPVVIVHGDADEAVPIEWSSRLVDDIGAELRTYRGADHMGVADAARADVVAALLAAIR